MKATAVAIIRLIGGSEAEGWHFDGRLVTPMSPMRRHAIYRDDGTLIVSSGAARSWEFDGYNLHALGGFGFSWFLSGNWLTSRQDDAWVVWSFDGRLLAPLEDPEHDQWLASDPVPLPVIMLAAGLI